jgi:hypothetical protein
MTNSEEIANQLNKRCTKDHRHIQISGNRAKQAQVYPEKLCKAIVKGLIRQMKRDGRLGNGGLVGAVEEGENEIGKCAEYWEYWDDISGKPLKSHLVKRARNEEMQQIWKHKLYDKKPISECIERTGKKPLGIRWVDVNKGDEDDEEYRSRLVAKEIKYNKREDLFAAMPPLEAKKMLFSFVVLDFLSHQSRSIFFIILITFVHIDPPDTQWLLASSFNTCTDGFLIIQLMFPYLLHFFITCSFH